MNRDIVFRCEDGEESVPFNVIRMSKMLVDILEDTPEGAIPIQSYASRALVRTLAAFCKIHNYIPNEDPAYYQDNPPSDEELDLLLPLADKDHCEFLRLVKLADYLQNDTLMLCCFRILFEVAKPKTEKQIRALLCIDSSVPMLTIAEKQAILQGASFVF